MLGGNGFIGSYIVDNLASKGHVVKVFDNLKDDIKLYKEDKNIEGLSRNFLNRSDISSALKDVDYVFHFISTTTPASSENDPLIDINTNIAMSVVLFEECIKSNIKKVIFPSTGGAIYGRTTHPSKETDLTEPVSPYAIGKLTIENYLRYYKEKHGLDYLILRPSNPYGPRQPFHRNQGVIPIFLERIVSGNDIAVMGDGEMQRDYVYVEDVAKAITDIFDKTTKHNIYNIGSGKTTTLNELVKIMKNVTQKNFDIKHKPSPVTFLSKSCMDVGRYESEFGKIAHTELSVGISNTYEYINKSYSNQN